MGRACSLNGAESNTYRLLVLMPEGKTPLGRPRHKWMDNVKIHLGDNGWGGVDWIGLAQDTDEWKVFVNVIMNLQIP
jgi:hypothetical protein